MFHVFIYITKHATRKSTYREIVYILFLSLTNWISDAPVGTMKMFHHTWQIFGQNIKREVK